MHLKIKCSGVNVSTVYHSLKLNATVSKSMIFLTVKLIQMSYTNLKLLIHILVVNLKFIISYMTLTHLTDKRKFDYICQVACVG